MDQRLLVHLFMKTNLRQIVNNLALGAICLLFLSLRAQAATNDLMIFWAPSLAAADYDHDRMVVAEGLPKLEAYLKKNTIHFRRWEMIGGWHDDDAHKDVSLPGYFYAINPADHFSVKELGEHIAEWFESKEVFLLKTTEAQWADLSKQMNLNSAEPFLTQLSKLSSDKTKLDPETIFSFSVQNPTAQTNPEDKAVIEQGIRDLENWLNQKVGGFSKWSDESEKRIFYIISPNNRLQLPELKNELPRFKVSLAMDCRALFI
jgi:hypothetical protein